MMRFRCAALVCALLLVFSTPVLADIQFGQPNVMSAAQAQGFTYRLKTTKPDSTTVNVILTGVICTGTGTAPISAACQAPTPPASAALISGSTTVLTAALSTVAPEGPPSPPFVSGTSAPTGLQITP